MRPQPCRIASAHETDLSANTTAHLLNDIEALRAHLGIARWLVLGRVLGFDPALAYALKHPGRVSEDRADQHHHQPQIGHPLAVS